MRTDANKIALRAIRSLLDGAKPFEIDVNGTRVACSVSAQPEAPWPPEAGGLVAGEDGPWPRAIVVDCTWTNGKCRFSVDVYRWESGVYRDDLCVTVYTDQGREIVFVNVSNELEQVEDRGSAKLRVRFYVTKRKSHVSSEVAAALNEGMRAVLGESELPIVGKNTAALCEVEAPSGALHPAPEFVFRRLIQLALLKLDFIDRRRTPERGTPLVDLSKWLTADQLAAVPGEVEEDAAEPQDGRSYWAAGFTVPVHA